MELDNLSLLNADLAGSGQGLMHRCRKSATAVNIAAGQVWSKVSLQATDVTEQIDVFWDKIHTEEWIENTRMMLREMKVPMNKKYAFVALLCIGSLPIVAFFLFSLFSVCLALISLLFFEGTLFALITCVMAGLILSAVCITTSIIVVAAGINFGHSPVFTSSDADIQPTNQLE